MSKHRVDRKVGAEAAGLESSVSTMSSNHCFMDRTAEQIEDRAFEFYRRVVALSRTQSIYSADDALQDTMVAALEMNISGMIDPERGSIDSLLTGVFRNKAKEGGRKYNRRIYNRVSEDLAGTPSDPAEIVMRREQEARTSFQVRLAVAQLPPLWRMAICEKFGQIEGVSVPGVRPKGQSTPSVHRNRAKKLLREMLQPVWNELTL